MPSLSLKITPGSDVEKKLLSELRARVHASHRELDEKTKAWREAEEASVAFIPERDVDAKRRRRREEGMPQYTTVTIPYTYAVIMSAHTYLTSVFMGRNPILQFTGRHGESQQKVQALEALVDYQVGVGKHLVPLYSWLYDAGRYGVGVIGMYWEERDEYVSTIEARPQIDALGRETGKVDKIQVTRKVKGYSGNKIYNIQPWDFMWDTRWPLRDFQKGEYCAVRFSLGWNECKRREAAGYYINLDALGPSPINDIYSRESGSSAMLRPETTSNTLVSWDDTSLVHRKHPAIVNGYEVYIEIIPKDWELSMSEMPEKWVFTCTGDFKRLIGAQPLGALHGLFPCHVLPLDCEAYGLVSRGMADILKPVQTTIDWLLNSHFYNVRANLNNKLVVDPSRVFMKDVLDPLPGGVIRLKPAAYGTDTRTPVTQLQVGDVTRQNVSDLQMMFGMGERTVGINDQIMGMLNSGGRKTATEIRTSTSFGVNRLKALAEWFSAVGFDPYAQMMVQNTQQYYDQAQMFKVAGDLVLNAGQNFIEVNPENITGFYDFVPVDGTLPIDRYAQANLWKEMMMQARTIPQIAMGYDWAGIFEWVSQLAGLKNITQFRVQLGSPQAIMNQVASGNLVPISGGKQGASGVNQPKQIPGMGPTA